jgi:hypothetical protein
VQFKALHTPFRTDQDLEDDLTRFPEATGGRRVVGLRVLEIRGVEAGGHDGFHPVSATGAGGSEKAPHLAAWGAARDATWLASGQTGAPGSRRARKGKGARVRHEAGRLFEKVGLPGRTGKRRRHGATPARGRWRRRCGGAATGPVSFNLLKADEDGSHLHVFHLASPPCRGGTDGRIDRKGEQDRLQTRGGQQRRKRRRAVDLVGEPGLQRRFVHQKLQR